MKKIFLVFTVLYTVVLTAQTPPPVLLKNQTILLEHGLKNTLLPNDSEKNQPRYYRLVQFQNLNSIHLNEETAGYRVLEYIPQKAFIISIDKTNIGITGILQEKGAVSATPIDASWKLSNRLFNRNIPEWSRNGSQVNIWLRVYRDFNMDMALNQIRSRFTVTDQNLKENLIMITIPPEKIAEAASLPFVSYVQEMEEPGEPENFRARTSHRINTLQARFPGAGNYDGSGVVVGLGDDGEIGPHIDFKGRLTQQAGGSNGDHGDHVAGTIFGAGNLDPQGKGMAPGAEIYYQSYPQNLTTVDQNYLSQNVRITNSSYSNGCNAGYTNFTLQMDQDVQENPGLIHVFSAGNDGTSDCGYGAGAGWGNITGGHKIAKNVVTVANLTYTDALSGSSSRGPASDGRIKPDVAAVGSSVYSTTNPNLYTLKSGTSMACPGVAGTLAVLYEAYRSHNQNSDPESGLLKAILMNTCDDLGNPGPDFKFGYGRVNARRAYEVIQDKSYIEDKIEHNETKSYQINIPGNTAEVRVMLYWPDVPASPVAARALVNDLDLEIIDNNSLHYLPWVLDPTPLPSNLNDNAVRARDSLNNMEQITFSNPSPGNITVQVNGFSIAQSEQEFYLVYEFVPKELTLTHPIGGEAFVPGEAEVIRWDAPEINDFFALDYSADGGANWSVITGFVPADRNYWIWNVPGNAGGNYKIRVRRGIQSSETKGVFTIVNTPENLRITRICPDSLQLNWDVVNGASGYVIYRLGTKYMDSIGYSTATYFTVPISNPSQTEWYSVAAVSQGKAGRRAFAIEKTSQGIINCMLAYDLNLEELRSPLPGPLPDCYSFSNMPLIVRLSNTGLNPIFNFNLSYSINNGTTVTQTITDTLAPQSFLDYTFSGATVPFVSGNNYDIKVWSTLTGDANAFNDTLHETFSVYNSTTASYPFTEDFESFNFCGTSSDCGQTVCTLTGGWLNAQNSVHDNIDWRVNSGSTPSSGTGPSFDHNPGNTNGKYLYLEASGGCDSSEAVLISPCIDLTSATVPVLDFWVHMFGANTGKIEVDVFDGTDWDYNIYPGLKGPQSSSWRNIEAGLLPYVGKKIIIRFRGKTGNDFASDIAIDDISVHESTTPPVAFFEPANTITCLDGVVLFSDKSVNIPTTWKWRIEPSAYTYINGTDNSSQNIAVQFHATGNYTVTLIVSNPAGTDSTTRSQAVTVSSGAPLPFSETFEGPFLPLQWTADQNSGFGSWSSAGVTGAFGGNTTAAVFDNFNSGTSAEESGLVSRNIDLQNATNPILFFDVAYSPRNNSQDSLIIDVSENCGRDFTATSYRKGGVSLQTAASSPGMFIPDNRTQWRRDTIDLSAYAGSNIKIRFRNYSDGGNAIYLDNIQVVADPALAPIPFFAASDTLACENDTITFTEIVTGGNFSSIHWDFGNGATPPAANTAGPHQVKYASSGTKQVTLTVGNDGGFAQYVKNININDQVQADFAMSQVDVQTVQFSDLSVTNPLQWHWDFGDGDTSDAKNPTHTYTSDGSYTVTLRVSNNCGFDEEIKQIVISGIGVAEAIGLSGLELYPNPGTGIFNLEVRSSISQPVEIDVMGLDGRLIRKFITDLRSGRNEQVINISDASRGIYLIRLSTAKGVYVIRAVKQ